MNCFSNLFTSTLKTLLFICIATLPTTVFSQGNEPPVLATDGSRLFPYKLPLNSTTKPVDITEGQGAINAPTGTERFTTSGVVLTRESDFSFSGFGIDGVQFISNYGLEIDFSYAMYKNLVGNPADGLTLFIYDGKSTLKLGQPGSALGYSDRSGAPGVENAYMAIGFDAIGNTKREAGAPADGEQHYGIPKPLTDYNSAGNHITIKAGSAPGSRLGYPIIYTTQTTATLGGKITQATLNQQTGTFTYKTDQILENPFSLVTGKTPEGKPKFHRVKVILTPLNQTTMEIDITVTVDGLERKVVKGLKYDGKLNYKKGTAAAINLNKSIPPTFKIGFAASTGAAYMVNIVSGIEIDLLNGAEPQPDFGQLNGYTGFDSSNKKVEIDVLSNDKYFRGIPPSITSGSDNTYIDSNTFEFENNKGIPFAGSTNHMKHIDPGVGIWTFDPATRLVTFELTKTDAKDGDTFRVNYSAKGFNTDGGPFADDPYRAKSTPITVTYHTKDANYRINPYNTLEFKN